MGIHGLTKLLGDCAPSSMKENEIKNYFGRFFVAILGGILIVNIMTSGDILTIYV